jgi:hypothetical protein
VFSFNTIKELINTLDWAKILLSEMFEKRKAISFKVEHALAFLSQERLDALCDKGVLRLNGMYLEMDDQLQEFFELALVVNEEINTAYIHENIERIKQNIVYFLQENNDSRRYNYLKQVKSSLRKTGPIVLRNIVDLNRNIDNTFKTEPNFKIKISKLENYDRKRQDINTLIEQTEKIIHEDEQVFFKTAVDDELKDIVTRLRYSLHEGRHNLIELQKQIIDYLKIELDIKVRFSKKSDRLNI